MSKAEILVTPVGEMRDMLDCLAIYNGASPKKKARKMSLLETLEVT